MTDNQKTLAVIAALVALSLVLAVLTESKPYYAITRGFDTEYALAPSPTGEKITADIALGESAGETAADSETRVIRNGSLSLLVDSISNAVSDAAAIAEKNGGFVEHSNTGENPDGSRYGYATIRVADEKFNDAIEELKDLAGRVKDESVTAQDVTERYTDLQARLRNARAEEQAYIALLNRAGSVSDLLQVQRELSQVRGRIESLQGQIQYLENQTDYSTITINFEEDRVITLPSKKFRFVPIVKDATAGLVAIAQWFVTAIVWIVIIGIPVGTVLFGAWKIYKKIRKTN